MRLVLFPQKCFHKSSCSLCSSSSSNAHTLVRITHNVPLLKWLYFNEGFMEGIPSYVSACVCVCVCGELRAPCSWSDSSTRLGKVMRNICRKRPGTNGDTFAKSHTNKKSIYGLSAHVRFCGSNKRCLASFCACMCLCVLVGIVHCGFQVYRSQIAWNISLRGFSYHLQMRVFVYLAHAIGSVAHACV